MSRFVNPVPQYFLDDGSVASSGKMKFFANKDYSTLKTTYSQSDNTVPNTNPVTLDGSGRMPPCFGEGLYSVKFYAYDPDELDGLGALQWTRDDVTLSELTGQFSDWSGLLTYNQGDIVQGGDGNYYRSFVGSNKANDPIGSPTKWEQVVFITTYNASRTYNINDNVVNDGLLYRCNTNGTVGVAPPAAQWDNLSFNNSVVGSFSATGTISAGTGISVGNVANASATVMDYYLESTFTPVIIGGTTPGVGTYTVQNGKYTRLGNVIFYTVDLTWTAHTGTGNFTISGLPIGNLATPIVRAPASVWYTDITVGAGKELIASIPNSTTSIYLYAADPAGGAFSNVAIDASGTVAISGFYFTI